MKLITKEIARKLNSNGLATRAAGAQGSEDPDHVPVVKFFDPTGPSTWLITESTPDDSRMLFGLCDLGMGSPELGYVSLDELESARGALGLPLERDLWFKTDKPLSHYTNEALSLRRINA